MLRLACRAVRFVASAFLVVVLVPATATAGDCPCSKEPRHSSRGHYSREANHGLWHYPRASYWASGDSHNHWGSGEVHGKSGEKIAPSPWAYSSIAPYSEHYHHFYGQSYGWDCVDCRN